MDDTSRAVVERLLRLEQTRVAAELRRIEDAAQPYRERLAELTQALEEYGFQERMP